MITWRASKRKQADRAAETRRRDRADSIASKERAEGLCELCGGDTTVVGQNHHDYRKNSHPELRHDKRNHFWLHCECHTWVHAHHNDGRDRLAHIREKRGDGALDGGCDEQA